MTVVLLVSCFIALAGYLFMTGFHDASNAVAVPVRARALTPKVAVIISAIFNILGLVMCAIFMREVLAPDWLNVPTNNVGLGMLLTALIAQFVWGAITWFFRMPSSSSHGLIGGLLGTVWATHAIDIPTANPFHESFFGFFILPLVLMPLLIFALSWLVMIPIYPLAIRFSPIEVNKASRLVLSFTNSLISLGHGVLAGQRALIVFVLISITAGFEPQTWIIVLALAGFAFFLGIGTLLGGWRISHTIAHRLVHVDPLRGAVAQTLTALTMIVAPVTLAATVSSSHLTSAAVLGSGTNQRFSAVRPNVALKLVLTWLATIPATFLMSATLFLALSPVL